MESRGQEHKIRWWQFVPNWLQLMFAIGGLLIAIGATYADVQGLKDKIGTVELNSLQQVKMIGEINNLQTQIKQANETQQQTNRSVDKLSDSVIDLGNAVSRLQGIIEDKPPKRR